MNILQKTTELAMHITLAYINEGDAVIDATAGNGKDTLKLAKAVGENGSVLAFDIQEKALTTTEKLLKENGFKNVEYINDNFVNLDKYIGFKVQKTTNTELDTATLTDNYTNLSDKSSSITFTSNNSASSPSPISAIVFNLGYLPNGDRTITTKKEDTIIAVQKALDLIKTGGIVTITMYPGHTEGAEEQKALLAFSKTLPALEYHAVYFSMHNQGEKAPEILAITKKYNNFSTTL